MSDRQLRITFQPHQREVFVLPGAKLLEAAARAGATLDTPCGGQGTCGKCRVRMTSGPSQPTAAEAAMFTRGELDEGWRLACQTSLSADAVVHVPDSSLFADQHQILAEAKRQAAPDVQPAVRKVYVDLSAAMADGADAAACLKDNLAPVEVHPDLLAVLPERLRASHFAGTAVLMNHDLIDLEAGDTTDRCYGAAFDIGTTTLVGSLLDLPDGNERAIVSRINPQVSGGDDVLSRIKYASSPAGLAELHSVIDQAVDEMVGQLCAEANVDRQNIYELTFAGNTTMQHLLCGLDVSSLGHVPFAPANLDGLTLPASQLRLAIHPRATAYVYPAIGGFVGGDTVAGMIAAALGATDGPSLMVDIGTNGEIVLAFDGQLWSASTAAGPAFEGARISCGMRAAAGAIEKVLLDDDVHCSTIGDATPAGLCGSGLIDAAAEMLDQGLISPEGRLLPPDELPADLAEPLKRRVRRGAGGMVEFLLAGDDRHPVTLNERDIRELQLACGAIRAGITILLKQAGLGSGDLRRVLLAGGFGSFIRRSHAQRIGLLPPQIDHQRICYVGNVSLDGARWALLSTRIRRQAESLARRTRHVQLSEDPNFQMEFVEAMIFPSRN